jgi:CTP-dependent riboflavin kinase
MRIQSGSGSTTLLIGIRVVAKSAGSEDPVITIMGTLLYGLLNGHFYTEKRVSEHKFRPKLGTAPWAHLGHHLVTWSL